jgi:uncharacterized protein
VEVIMTNKKTVILSIDGGGVKGIIPIMILKEIENLLGKPISENIDYFTGTSSGALIGAALALKDEVNTQKIFNMINKVTKNIFKEKSSGLFDSKYDRSEFDNQLEEIFKNTKLSETKFPISVSAFNLNDYTPKIWSTLKSLKNPSDDALLKDVLGASVSAPYYFDPKQINDDFFIDSPYAEVETEVHQQLRVILHCNPPAKRLKRKSYPILAVAISI